MFDVDADLKLGSLACLLALLTAACASHPPSGSTPASPSPTLAVATPLPSTAAAAPTPSPSATVGVASSRYGQVLVDGAGLTLYLFTADSGSGSACYSACAKAWPPLTARGPVLAGAGAAQSLIGTTSRSDGELQVTYNGHPLYYYVGDRAAGEIKCQAVFEFGGGWYIVSPGGVAITSP